MSEKNNIVSEFNSTLEMMLQFVAKVCPTTVIGRHLSHIETLLKDPKNKTKFIDVFIEILQQPVYDQ